VETVPRGAGRPKKSVWDKVQLCAQAICLEEMLNINVPRGSLVYGKTRRRVDVDFDASLRVETEQTARRLHELIAGGRTPPRKMAIGHKSPPLRGGVDLNNSIPMILCSILSRPNRRHPPKRHTAFHVLRTGGG
jgi:hypothetical protein